MEGLIKGVMTRTFAVAGIFLATGAFLYFSPKTQYETKTEDQLIAMAPERVGNFGFVRGYEDPRVSYRMDQSTYDVLDPFGIVARRYAQGSRVYDMVLVASTSKDSFHDPRVCFSAQGWTLEKFEPDTVKTETRGEIPITIITMSGPTGRNKLAAFWYRGPGQFYGNTQRLKLGMFLEKFRGGKDIDGVFYRVIPDYNGATKESLKGFIAKYLDAAKVSSNGYF